MNPRQALRRGLYAVFITRRIDYQKVIGGVVLGEFVAQKHTAANAMLAA